MSNFKQIPYESAEGELKQLYDDISSTLNTKDLPNWVTYLGSNIHLLRGIWHMFQGMALNGTLNPLLQELIIFSVSYNRGSEYCAEFHACQVLKLQASLDFEQLREISQGESHGVLPDRFISAINFARDHIQSSCLLKPEDIEPLIDMGFSSTDVDEIIGLCSLALAFNTLTMGGNIPIDQTQKVEGFGF